DEVLSKISSIVKKIEPDVYVKEKEKSIPGRKVICFSGLNCADCALKIENEVKRIDGIKDASVDFVNQKMIIDTANKHDLNDAVEHATEILLRLEPDVRLDEVKNKDYAEIYSHKELIKRITFGVGVLIFVIANIGKFAYWVEFSMFLISYLLIGSDVALRALKNTLRGQVFDENFLMSVATVGAFATGEFSEGVAVMLFYKVGEFFQDIAVNRSRKSITDLMDIRPDYANIKIDNEIRKVSPDEVCIGNIIIVKPGEKIPLDGKVIEGKSVLDTSALTGESVPRDVEVGSEVLSGSINKSGVLAIEVTKEFAESTVSKILDLAQNAGSKKAATENFITKFARYYTPFVVFSAIALAVIPPLAVTGASFSEWINRALVFLVVSCPCALVISIPLSFFGGIGGAARNGILIKGSNFLEAMTNIDTVIFDKTGTLTKGIFKVTRIMSKNVFKDEEILEYAAYAEGYSNHPISTSIKNAYGKEIDKTQISDYEEIPGCGISAKVRGKSVLAGNDKLMEKEKIPYEEASDYGTILHLSVDGNYAGYISISDEIKSDSKNAMKALKNLGIKRLVMLTGDKKSVGEKIGNEIGMDEVYSELLPHQKVEKLEMLDKKKTTGGKLIFVGDGINDAPVLARADVGIAMGGLGADAAIEAADVVLMTDEPSKLVSAIKIAGRTRNVVIQNVVFAMGVKGIILLLGAAGIATMWEAVFGDVGVAIIAILNATRVMKLDKTLLAGYFEKL
ncbi:MAG: heavy metal translocating P-type ATPase, partial [Bacillota bacterium]|nr:heavy metal translocating P-type ATPase [Bacillota bacterium]